MKKTPEIRNKQDCKTMHELSDIMRMGKMSGAVFQDYLKFKEMRGELAHTKKVLDLMGEIGYGKHATR